MSNELDSTLTERERALITAALEAERRKRRTVQLLLAVAVLMLVACGGAFAWWQAKQAAARMMAAEQADAERRILEVERDTEQRLKAEQARAGVAADLQLATDLRKQFKFKEANAALAQAARLAESGAPQRRAEVRRAQADLAFVVQLDDIRFRKWNWTAAPDGKGNFNTKVAPAEYRKAFAAYGLDLPALDAAEAAEQIAASAIKAELVAALDDWALYEPDVALRDKLLEIARKADPTAWTDRLRDPATRADRKAIVKLAEEVDLSVVSPTAVYVLAELMKRHGLDPAPLLNAALAKHPADFELAFALCQWFAANKPEQQIEPLRAASKLQPKLAKPVLPVAPPPRAVKP